MESEFLFTPLHVESINPYSAAIPLIEKSSSTFFKSLSTCKLLSCPLQKLIDAISKTCHLI